MCLPTLLITYLCQFCYAPGWARSCAWRPVLFSRSCPWCSCPAYRRFMWRPSSMSSSSLQMIGFQVLKPSAFPTSVSIRFPFLVCPFSCIGPQYRHFATAFDYTAIPCRCSLWPVISPHHLCSNSPVRALPLNSRAAFQGMAQTVLSGAACRISPTMGTLTADIASDILGLFFTRVFWMHCVRFVMSGGVVSTFAGLVVSCRG
jgi:hypothetical protein